MNLLLLRPDDRWLDHQTVVLNDQRAHHIRTVLKAAAGETLRAGLLGGQLGQAVLTSVAEEGVTLRVDCQDSPPPAIASTLCSPCPAPRCCDGCCARWRNSVWPTCT